MLRTALRRARPASSVAPRRGIASGQNLLQLSTSDLQPARTWDAAEADGVCAASGNAPSPPSQLFSVELRRSPAGRARREHGARGAPSSTRPTHTPRLGFADAADTRRAQASPARPSSNCSKGGKWCCSRCPAPLPECARRGTCPRSRNSSMNFNRRASMK
uniref:Uncharacterized protein n=1 Tax=Pelagomonas calceolata TaxID=35677 RepID=A0A7S3ZYX7_9STRA